MKKKLSVLLIIVLAIVLICTTSVCFADSEEASSVSSTTLTSLAGEEIDISNIENYLTENILNASLDETVRVIVKYNDEKSHNIVDDLKTLGCEVTLNYTYSKFFTGSSITILSQDILSLSNLSYVKSVSICPQYTVLSTYSSSSGTNEGIIDNTTSYQGDGMVVAVIDGSFDVTHEAFSNISSTTLTITKDTYSQSLIKSLNSYSLSGATAADLYLSDKIVYAYDYGEYDVDVYDATLSHGTHVAGILAGNSSTFKGVVPNAQLALMKVADSEGIMYDDSIISALEDCLTLNVDVVNMSLGSNGGFSYKDDDGMMLAIDKLESQGITVVCAAGNATTSAVGGESGDLADEANIDNSAVCSPATYASSYSIGSAAEIKYMMVGSSKIEYNDVYYYKTSSDGDFYNDFVSSGSLDYIILKNGDDIAYGKESDYEGLDVTNKIVVVQRSADMTVTEKIAIAKEKGAKGVIIVNNTEGSVNFGVQGSDTIPTISVTSSVGKILIQNATSNEGTLTLDSSYYYSGISSFSSRGVNDDLTLGIDVVAYGTGIYSLGLDQSYMTNSGTSMASPNAAGAFTIIKQYVKANASTFGIDATNKIEISTVASRLLMSNTTLLTDINGVLYSPRSQGAGLVDINKATSTLSYITTFDSDGNEIDKTKIELGDNVSNSFVLKLKVSNFSTTSETYEISANVLTEALTEDNKMSGLDEELTFAIIGVKNGNFSNNKWTVTVDAGSSAEIEITIALDSSAMLILDKFTNGTYVEGYVYLNGTNNTLTCPFIGFYGDWDDASMLDITAYDEANGSEAAMRASTSYGIYAGSYYIPMGEYAYEVAEGYEKPTANEEYSALSIYSSSMYALGYIQLGLLRNAERIELVVSDSVTGSVLTTGTIDYATKTMYFSAYGMLYGGDLTLTISPYKLGLSNNGKYNVTLNIYRTYDEESEENTISDTYTQNFYVDYELPEITDIKYTTENGKVYANIEMYDNHYIQAIGICTGKGTSATNVTLTAQDFYPVATSADGVGQTKSLKIDITDAISKASNGYIYFYVVDYAFNANIYYDSISNMGNQTSTSKKGDTSDSKGPTAQTDLTESKFEFVSSEIEIAVDQEIDLAQTKYLTGYNVEDTFTWTASKGTILAMSNGKITGLSEGMAVVSVTNKNNVTTSLIVNVVADSNNEYESAAFEKAYISGYSMKNTITEDGDSFFDINVENNEIKLAPNESLRFEYGYTPYNYNYVENPITIYINIADTNIVSLTNGTLKAVSEGTTTVTIKVNGATGTTIAEYSVTVSPEIYINENKVLLACFSLDTNIDLSSKDIVAISSKAFTYAKNAETITLPATCTTISEYAFANNASIKNVVFTNNKVTYIKDHAFSGDVCLESIDLTGVAQVGDYAFENCSNLNEVILDSQTVSDISISMLAFDGCSKLENFTIDGNKTPNIIIDGMLVMSLDYESILTDSTIKSIGKNVFSNLKNEDTIDLTGTSIERIENGAFEGNSEIKYVYLPSSINYIGSNAFSDCESLCTLNIASGSGDLYIGSYAFANTAIDIINIKDKKTTLGDYVFMGDTSLVGAMLGSVQKIGKYTFAKCTSLQKVVLADGSKDLGTYTFAPITENNKTYYLSKLSTVTIPNTITSIGEYVFAYCTSLKTLETSNIESVGDYSFYGCTSLNSLAFNKASSIGYAAFANSSIQSIEIGNSLTSGTIDIDGVAFYGCENLSTVKWPTSEGISIKVGYGSFYKCTSLATSSSFVIGGFKPTTSSGINLSRVESVEDYGFAYCEALNRIDLTNCKEIGYAAFAECSKLTSVTLGSVESIEDLAFINTKITKITLPSSLTYLGMAVFGGTSAVVSVEDNNNLVVDATSDGYSVIYTKLDNGSLMLAYYPISSTSTSYSIKANTSYISSYAFYNAQSLKSITIPATVKYIGHAAFYGCSSLSSVYFSGTSAPALLAEYNSDEDDLYCNFVNYVSEVEGLTLYVGSNSVKETFNNNPTWSSFFSSIRVSSSIDIVDDVDLDTFKNSLNNFGSEVTAKNYKQFEKIVTMYSNLSTEDIEELRSTTDGGMLYNKYNTLLAQYNELNTGSSDDTTTNSDSIPKWAIILLVVGGALVILGLTGFVFVYLSKGMLRKNNVVVKNSEDDIENVEKKKETKKEKKKDDFNDIFKDN